MGIHNYEKGYERELLTVQESELSSKNKYLIMQFHDSLVVDGISKPRLVKVVGTLRRIAESLKKDFDVATVEDIRAFVVRVQQREDYSSWTKRDQKIIIRKFYKWLHKTSEYPEIVSWIKIGISRSEMRLPSDGELITPKEARMLLDGATHPRDKALISVLWESGARVSEVGNLKIKNVMFDRYGTVISVRGKTGSRKIRLIESTPYLSTWLNCLPDRKDPESSVWINIGNTKRGKQMKYAGICRVLRSVVPNILPGKRWNPHFFRHSRATYMANFLTEFQMNQYFGWIQGSNMPAIYVHMSGKEVDKAVLAMNGIKETSDEKEEEHSRICPRCEKINPVSTSLCFQCGAILDEKTAFEAQEREIEDTKVRSFSDQLMNKLLKDEEVQKLIAKKVQGLGSMSP